jgi:hypothetical protein
MQIQLEGVRSAPLLTEQQQHLTPSDPTELEELLRTQSGQRIQLRMFHMRDVYLILRSL